MHEGYTIDRHDALCGVGSKATSRLRWCRDSRRR